MIDEATENPETEHAALPPEAEPQADGQPPTGETAAPTAETPSAEAPSEAPAAAPVVEAKKPAPRKPRDPAVIRAFRAGQPVQGTVEKVIKGGYEVKVGRCRGFCPQSQIDAHRPEHAEEHVGKTYAFKILQLRRGGEDVVISRRALIEAEHEEEMKAVRATLIEGAVMTGRVARLAEFGAFVDLGAGVTGLVHTTELAHGRVVKPGDIVAVGDRVPVKVTKLDEATGKISLSIRQAITDPWESVPSLFEVGKAYHGTLKRFADFGAFVELRRGIEALAPAREFPPRAGGWRDGLDVEGSYDWIVIAVDGPRRRITVVPAFPGWEAFFGPLPEPGTKLTGKVAKAEVFGIFVWLGPGRVGMVPRVWSGAANGPGFESRFPVGSDIAVEVVDVQEEGRRIRLSVEGVDREAADAEQAARRESARPPRREARQERPRREPPPPPPPAQDPGGGFGGHLGEALRAALGKK